jgi:hypothetical protein
VSGPGIVASNFRWLRKNTLQASVDLDASAEWTDRSGAKRYVDIIEITDSKVRTRFQAAALATIHAIANRSGGRPGASPDQPKGDK